MVKSPLANARDIRGAGFDPCVGKIPWRRAWQPTPIVLPGASYRQRRAWRAAVQRVTELDATEET